MDIKNQWDQDESKENKKEDLKDEQTAIDLEKETVATDNTPIVQTNPVETTASVDKPEGPAASPSSSLVMSKIYGAPTVVQETAHKARRFLIAYMTSVFSAIVILYGTAWLGYVLADHFLGPKKDESSWFYIDFAPFYISLMATLAVFGGIYIVASRYVAKSASDDSIGLKDWRAYKVVYAIFTAILITTGASVIAGLLYIPLAQLMIAEDLESKRILVQVIASLHVLVWIGALIWQERLVKKAKQSWLQGFVVIVGVAVVVVATGIWPVGSKTDERFDHRAESDLTAIETKIEKYKNDNKNNLPESLSNLKFEEDETVKSRIKDYTYTVKAQSQDSMRSSSGQQQAKVNATILRNANSTDSDSESGSSQMSDEDYYNSLYESMYSSRESSDYQLKSYELCATFRTDTTAKNKDTADVFSALSGSSSSSYSFASHKSGKVCFNRN